ncbi:unnamed protein product [Boreogadus saida]
MGQPDLKVLQDCPTRWNSTFFMLKRFVRQWRRRVNANHLKSGCFKQPVVVSESSILDPRFKRKTFSDDQAATEAIQRLTTAAAQATISNPSQQEALVEKESMVWGDFDEQVSGLVSHLSAGAEASLEIRSFLQPSDLVEK